MSFEWDEASKAGISFRRHGVRMPEAIPVFDDPYAITWRGENIRIVSARPAEPHEHEDYEAQR